MYSEWIHTSTLITFCVPRRPLAVRRRRILSMFGEYIDDKHFTLQLRTEAGTYPFTNPCHRVLQLAQRCGDLAWSRNTEGYRS